MPMGVTVWFYYNRLKCNGSWLVIKLLSLLIDYNLWDKYKPQPVDIKPGSIGDYYDICEEIGR